MANFFDSILHRAGDLVSYPVKATKDTIIHPKKGIKEWEHLYTHNEHEDQKMLQEGFGIHGWVGKHPQETAAAVVATIFGGWAAWGAYGAGAAGGAMGAAGGATGGTAAGTAGSALAYTPTASTVLGGAGSAGTTSALTYGGSMAGNAVAATGSTWGVGAGGSVGLSGAATTGGISGAGVGTSSMAFAAPEGSAMAYMPTQSTVLGGGGSGAPASSGSDWMDWAQKANQARNMMQNSNGQQGQQQKQQDQLKPQSVDLLHRLMGDGLNKIQTSDSGQMQPQSTTDIIGGNQNYSGSSFSNQF